MASLHPPMIATVDSPRLLLDLLDAVPLAVYVRTLDERFLLVNRSWEALTGKSRADVIGKNLFEVWPFETAIAFQRANDEVVRTGRPLVTEESAMGTDGMHWFQSFKFPMYDETGTMYAVGGVSPDITARKRLDRLIERYDRIDSALAVGRIGIWAWDVPRFRLDITQGVAPLFDIDSDPDSVTFEDLARRVHEEDRPAFDAFAHCVRTFSEECFAEIRIPLRSGGERWLAMKGSTLERVDHTVTRVSGAVLDVTQRKQDMLELQRARDAAETASRAKDVFLGILSHELRTPLTPALLLLSAHEHDMSVPAGVRSDLSIARKQIEIESRLIDDLLDLTKQGGGRLTVPAVAIDAHEVIRSAIQKVEQSLLEKGHHLQMELKAEQTRVAMDEVALQKVVTGVLDNSIKFTPAGGSIHVGTTLQGTDLLMVIRDNGVGISAALLAHVFTPFTQGDPTLSRFHGGLGIGLALSRSLMEIHRGSVGIESAGNGLGTAVTLRLPLL